MFERLPNYWRKINQWKGTLPENGLTVMKSRVIPAVLYAFTALVLANWFEDVDGMEPGPIPFPHIGSIQIAIIGTVVFAIACLASLANLRYGVALGLLACVLSWPYFAGILLSTPLRRLASLLGDSTLWRHEYSALLLLAISSAYSLAHLRYTRRARDEGFSSVGQK
jgi:hypothetical protein